MLSIAFQEGIGAVQIGESCENQQVRNILMLIPHYSLFC